MTKKEGNLVIKFGTRGSKLALIQTESVMESIRVRFPDVESSKVIIKTLGDKVTNVPLFKVGGQGLFIKELEKALMTKEIDLAVHSLKDVPHQLHEGLCLCAVTRREDSRDVLLSRSNLSLKDLPPRCRIGTSSLRRRAQIIAIRADVIFEDLRGNLDTRLRKLNDGAVDAIVLAAAGLNRLGYDGKFAEIFPTTILTPAAGQGFLAIECRIEDIPKFAPILKDIDDPISHICADAERSFLTKIQGGCQTPMAVHARLENSLIIIDGFLGTPDGRHFLRDTITGGDNQAKYLGETLASNLLSSGGNEILKLMQIS